MCASALREERSAPSSHRAAHMFHIFNHGFIETYYVTNRQFIFLILFQPVQPDNQ